MSESPDPGITDQSQSSAPPSGAHTLVRQLRAEGVRHVFGVPGAQIMGMLDALYDYPDIAFITNRHEQGSGYMADGSARVTGRPGVLATVPGVGVYNAGAAIATAYACSYPVLLLAGQVSRDKIGKNTGILHEVHDQLEILRPITKWAHRELDGARLGAAVHEAFGQMLSNRPQPASLEFPPEALAEPGSSGVLPPARRDQPAVDLKAVSKAAEFAAAAASPLIIAGGGAVGGDAYAEVTALAERIQAAVLVTREGKAAIDNRHPLFVGSTWANTRRLADVYGSADLVIAIGTRLEGYTLRPGQRLIRIDVDPSRLADRQDVALLGDAREVLAALTGELEMAGPRPSSRSAEVARMREALVSKLREFPQTPIVDALRAAIPDDAVIAGGTTTVGYMCHAYLPIHSPRGYLSTSYMGTLGFSLAMGLGAKLGAPDRPVVTISGDGGFLFGATELATAVQYGLNTINVVFNDNAYGNPNREQHEDWGGRAIGTELINPDFVAFARSFGVEGVKVSDPDSLSAAIKDALSHEGPTLIEYPHERLPYVFRDPPREAAAKRSGQ